MSDDTRARIDRIYREEYGRVVASLARRFGDLDIAEDAAGEALLTAIERWPVDDILPTRARLTKTAGNRAIDRIRRELLRDAKHQAAMIIDDHTPHEPTGPVNDDRLRLVFTCCHPALAPEARVALTLRLLGGLTVGEIARAFLVAETTMAQRITRAKAKIKAAHIPFRVPDRDDVTDRLGGVLAVIYLVFNEGYRRRAIDSDRLDGRGHSARSHHARSAARRRRGCRVARADAAIDARSAARIAGGELVTLDEQDRGGWDHALIAEGHALVRECLRRVAAGGARPGRYQLMAAINAVHTDAADSRDTDWNQIVALYDQLYAVTPTAIVALNRAVAIAELDGPNVALAQIDSLPLDGYHAWHAARADLLRRLGRGAEARSAYDAAIAATQNPAERAYLTRRREHLV